MKKIQPAALAVVVSLALTACSGARMSNGGPLPQTPGFDRSGAADAGSMTTSPAISNGTLSYTTVTSTTITTHNGPEAPPRTRSLSDRGTTFLKLTVDKSTGNYDEISDTRMDSGSKQHFDLTGLFVKSGATVRQYFSSLTYSGVDTLIGHSTFSGTDHFPNRELGVVFPLRAGAHWSSAAEDRFTTEDANIGRRGRVVAENIGKGLLQANGFYTARDTWRNERGAREYGERFDVTGPTALSYSLSLPNYAPEIWAFGRPAHSSIDVAITSSGRTAFPKGVRRVPDWYPGGSGLPSSLVMDDLHVGTSNVRAPAACHLAGMVPVVTERYSMLDPVAGVYATSIDRYFGWSKRGDFPACLTETDRTRMYANGIWYVSWHNGEPYYDETDTLVEAMNSKNPSLAPAVTAIGGAALLGAPMGARMHVTYARLTALAASGSLTQ